MKYVVALASVLLILASCQTKPVVAPLPEPPAPVVTTPQPKKPIPMVEKQAFQTVVIKPKPIEYLPNTITHCPAGMSGGLVGAIERGRHCFTSQPEPGSRCLNTDDQVVLEKAENYCGKLKTHMTRVGRWRPQPHQQLRAGVRKRSSCRCGVYKGKDLCKAFFNFRCRWESQKTAAH